jgi:hypothetical protein
MRALAIAAVSIALTGGPVLAQSPPSTTPPPTTPVQIHGMVEKLDGPALAVKSRGGSLVTIALAPDFTVAGIVRKDAADIKTGDYVGVGSFSGMDGKMHALEVLIFPEALRGTAEGQTPWPLQMGGRITNGTVSGIAEMPGGRTLSLTYQEGEAEIVVGPEARVVTAQPADASLLQPGAAVFVVAQQQPDGSLTASWVTAEKDGVKPPM